MPAELAVVVAAEDVAPPAPEAGLDDEGPDVPGSDGPWRPSCGDALPRLARARAVGSLSCAASTARGIEHLPPGPPARRAPRDRGRRRRASAGRRAGRPRRRRGRAEAALARASGVRSRAHAGRPRRGRDSSRSPAGPRARASWLLCASRAGTRKGLRHLPAGRSPAGNHGLSRARRATAPGNERSAARTRRAGARARARRRGRPSGRARRGVSSAPTWSSNASNSAASPPARPGRRSSRGTAGRLLRADRHDRADREVRRGRA